MPDVESFPFTGVPSRRGIVFRPLIRVHLIGPADVLETQMLLDSGADVSVIDLGMAEKLGLDLGPIEIMAGMGIDVPGYTGQVALRVSGLPARVSPLDLPVFMHINRKLPSFPVLGGTAFFQAFDVRFEMGPNPSAGEFYVSVHA